LYFSFSNLSDPSTSLPQSTHRKTLEDDRQEWIETAEIVTVKYPLGNNQPISPWFNPYLKDLKPWKCGAETETRKLSNGITVLVINTLIDSILVTETCHPLSIFAYAPIELDEYSFFCNFL
jgi:hypothetical protein